jgi:hypothetical protein
MKSSFLSSRALVISVVAIMAFAFGARSITGNDDLTPAQTLLAYFAACTSADTARTYELASASHRAWIKPIAKSYFAMEYATPDTVQILGSKLTSDKAVVKFHLVQYDRATAHQKGSYELSARMIKEDGMWKFDTIYNADLNLAFEEDNDDGRPRGWYAGGGGRSKKDWNGYTGTLDSAVKHSGKFSLCLSYNAGDGFGVGTQSISGPLLDEIRGKKIRFSGWIRTKDVGHYAGLWWRVDGPNDRVLGFKNMQVGDDLINGTRGWQEYSIELSIDPAAEDINFGVQTDGGGIAWFDDLSIDTNGVLWMK